MNGKQGVCRREWREGRFSEERKGAVVGVEWSSSYTTDGGVIDDIQFMEEGF